VTSKHRFPIIYIGQVVPEGWGVEYPTVTVKTLKELRAFASSYTQIKAAFEVGLDVRDADYRCYPSLLKLMEDSRVRLHVRINEPVIDTIVSRAGMVLKKEKLEIQSVSLRLVPDDGSLGTKVRGLLLRE